MGPVDGYRKRSTTWSSQVHRGDWKGGCIGERARRGVEESAAVLRLGFTGSVLCSTIKYYE